MTLNHIRRFDQPQKLSESRVEYGVEGLQQNGRIFVSFAISKLWSEQVASE